MIHVFLLHDKLAHQITCICYFSELPMCFDKSMTTYGSLVLSVLAHSARDITFDNPRRQGKISEF